mgnify:FL=1
MRESDSVFNGTCLNLSLIRGNNRARELGGGSYRTTAYYRALGKINFVHYCSLATREAFQELRCYVSVKHSWRFVTPSLEEIRPN